MALSVKIRVPATSANCGPGFDTLGLACSMYSTFTYEVIEKGLELEVLGEGSDRIKANRHNLAILSFFKVWDIMSEQKIGLRVIMNNAIPLARGLGSSSSAIVAGLTAANYLTGSKLSQYDLLNLATEIEGHPDNVAPAIFGGITVSYMRDGKANALKFMPSKPFQLVAIIPELALSTRAARQVLPQEIKHQDAVFNASRTGLLVAALLSGDYTHLTAGLEDRLHQPYRLGLIPGADHAFAAARAQGAYNAVISGAGSTLMAYLPVECSAEKVALAMQKELAAHNITASYQVLKLDETGAQVLPNS